MKTKMTAVAMVAVMIVAAFAVVGMADNGVADNTSNGQKNIIGTEKNPYALKIGDSNAVTAKIDYNYDAFTSKADRSIDFVWSMTGTSGGKGTIVPTDANTGNAEINGIAVKITKNTDNAHILGAYTVTFKGVESKSLTDYTKIDFTLKITDKTSDNKTLPEQTFTFTAYLIVVADADKTIQLSAETGALNTENGVTFSYETAYEFNVKVISTSTNSNVDLTGNDYKYYATGLPDGLSMTVEGKIGGKLSANKNLNNGSFTIFAVSKFGDVVSKTIDYTISASVKKDFNISGEIDPANNGTVNLDSNPGYVTIKVKSSLKLTIEPENGYTLSNLKVTYSGKDSTVTDNNSATLTFDGTGVVVVTVSANVGPDNGPNPLIVKTFTVYVVGEIFNTDLDPEVTN